MSISYFRDVLPSGLRVVTVEAPHLHTAFISVYVRAGSRHEQPSNNGVSHFLEHMFFRGSESYPDTVKMNAAVEEAGGNLNGVTTRDHGYYFTPLHPNELEIGVRILGDMLTRPLFTQMEVERQIILEEMLDEVDEKGRDIDLDNLAKKEMFNGHPLSLKIAGTAASVRALTEEQLRDHFARYYVAENLVFAAAGKVSRQRVLESVRASFDRLPRGKRSSPKNAPPGVRGPSFKFVRHNEAQTAFRLSFRAVPEHHPDFPALALIRRILDDGLSSRLPFNIVERRGLAYSVHAGMELFDDLGLFEIEAASAPEKAAAVFEEVCRTLAEIKTTRIRGEELNRAKRRYRIHLGFAQDSPGDLAAWFGGTELFRTPDSFEQSIRRVEARSAPRVQRTAQRYFSAENLSVIAVGQNRGIRALRRCVDSARDLLG